MRTPAAASAEKLSRCTIRVSVFGRPNGGIEPPRGEAERSARTTCYTPVNGWLPTRVSLATRHALAELLGKPDNDALRAADVAEPIRVLVLHHFAEQFGAVGARSEERRVGKECRSRRSPFHSKTKTLHISLHLNSLSQHNAS